MSRVIYGPSDIAVELGVSRQVISNYLARYDNTPAPAYETPGGQRFWDAKGLDRWRIWYNQRNAP